MKKTEIKINKNNKIYEYLIPDYENYDYKKLTNFLSDLDIKDCKITYRYCTILSKKKILSKLRKYFGKKYIETSISNYDNSYCYFVELMDDKDWNNFIYYMDNKN